MTVPDIVHCRPNAVCVNVPGSRLTTVSMRFLRSLNTSCFTYFPHFCLIDSDECRFPPGPDIVHCGPNAVGLCINVPGSRLTAN